MDFTTNKKMRILYLPSFYAQQRQYEKKANIYPILLAMEATWHKNQGDMVDWNNAIGRYDRIISEPEGLPFLSLPHANRLLTKWWKYQDNGNFKYKPATYIQSAKDCWWHKCTFCRWAVKYPNYEVRIVEDVVNEIFECKLCGFKEVFDDSGTFPIGQWLEDFCKRVIDVKIKLGCNMRIVDVDYKLMKWAGFRMLLFGLESANQYTLDRINKGIKVEDIKYIIKASKVGLEPHISVMFGYPWETDKDAINTLKLVWWLLKKGYAKTAQASFYRPFDNIVKSNHRKYVKRIYDVWKSPQFWFNQLKDIKDKNDLRYLWKKIKVGLWH